MLTKSRHRATINSFETVTRYFSRNIRAQTRWCGSDQILHYPIINFSKNFTAINIFARNKKMLTYAFILFSCLIICLYMQCNTAETDKCKRKYFMIFAFLSNTKYKICVSVITIFVSMKKKKNENTIRVLDEIQTRNNLYLSQIQFP